MRAFIFLGIALAAPASAQITTEIPRNAERAVDSRSHLQHDLARWTRQIAIPAGRSRHEFPESLRRSPETVTHRSVRGRGKFRFDLPRRSADAEGGAKVTLFASLPTVPRPRRARGGAANGGVVLQIATDEVPAITACPPGSSTVCRQFACAADPSVSVDSPVAAAAR